MRFSSFTLAVVAVDVINFRLCGSLFVGYLQSKKRKKTLICNHAVGVTCDLMYIVGSFSIISLKTCI